MKFYSSRVHLPFFNLALILWRGHLSNGATELNPTPRLGFWQIEPATGIEECFRKNANLGSGSD